MCASCIASQGPSRLSHPLAACRTSRFRPPGLLSSSEALAARSSLRARASAARVARSLPIAAQRLPARDRLLRDQQLLLQCRGAQVQTAWAEPLIGTAQVLLHVLTPMLGSPASTMSRTDRWLMLFYCAVTTKWPSAVCVHSPMIKTPCVCQLPSKWPDSARNARRTRTWR